MTLLQLQKYMDATQHILYVPVSNLCPQAVQRDQSLNRVCELQS